MHNGKRGFIRAVILLTTDSSLEAKERFFEQVVSYVAPHIFDKAMKVTRSIESAQEITKKVLISLYRDAPDTIPGLLKAKKIDDLDDRDYARIERGVEPWIEQTLQEEIDKRHLIGYIPEFKDLGMSRGEALTILGPVFKRGLNKLADNERVVFVRGLKKQDVDREKLDRIIKTYQQILRKEIEAQLSSVQPSSPAAQLFKYFLKRLHY